MNLQTRNRLLIGAVAVILAAAPLGVASADPVRVRTGTHEGYGRVVFKWPAPVPYTSEILNQQLVIQFERPVESNFAGLPGNLARYIRRPRLRDGGRTVVIPLTGRFGFRSFALGNSVVVDVLDAADEPAGAQSAGPRAAAPTTVAVRTGQHTGYTRIVFDWPSRVAYQVRKTDNAAVVTFRRGANIDLGQINGRRLPFVSRARTTQADGSTVVTLDVSPASRLRHFLSGARVVVDVLRPTPAAARETAAVTPQSPPEAPSPPAPPPETPAAQPAEEAKPEPTSEPASDPAPDTPGPVAAPVATITPPPAAAAKPPQAAAPGPAQTAASGQPPQSLGPPQMLPGVTAGPVALTPNRSVASSSENKAVPPSAAAQAGLAPSTAPAVEAPPPQDISAVTLRLKWKEPVAAAVFRRASNLWIVFDQSQAVDTKALEDAGRGAIRAIQQLTAARGTILRLSTVSGINPSLRRDGFDWLFDFKKQQLKPQTAIEVRPQASAALGATLFLPIPEAGAPVAFQDSEIGDNLVVVPVIPLAHGMPERREFAQLRILPSAQGVVVKPQIDTLRVRSVQQGVELSSSSNLALSSNSPKAQANANFGSFQSLSRVLPSAAWRRARRDRIADYVNSQNDLLYQVARAKAGKRHRARVKLAIYYIGKGFAAEALGVLRQIESERPESSRDPEFLLLRGATRYLLRRYAEAGEDLSHASLQDNDEAEFWRAIVAAAEGDEAEAAPILKRVGGIFRPYPRDLKINLGMRITRAAIAVGDVKMGTTYLEALAEEEPTAREVDRLANLEGNLKQLAGDFDGAVAAWEAAENGEDRRSQANATMSRAELLLTQGKIGPEEAIGELESLRFAWRGDDFEFNLLRRLGRLYLQVEDYRNGLRTLRQAVTYFRDNEATKDVTQLMADAFIQLYLEDAADTMKPVQAIALYEEFRELTPGGERGDEMIRKLADRLLRSTRVIRRPVC